MRRMLVGAAGALLVSACASGLDHPDMVQAERPRAAVGGAGQEMSLIRLGERTGAAGDHRSALGFYQEAFQANPESSAALVGMARSFELLGQYARAERSLRRALELDPHDKEARLLLGRALLGLERPAEAEAEFEWVLERAPRELRAYLGKGVAHDLRGQHEQAQEVYGAGLGVDPTHLSLLNNLGLSLAFLGNHQEALGILRELVGDPAAPAKVRRNLALVYVLAGRRKAAAATLAVDLSPQEVEEELLYYERLRDSGPRTDGAPTGRLELGAVDASATAATGRSIPTASAIVRVAGAPVGATRIDVE